MWQQLGKFEYQVDPEGRGYTGWCRCVGDTRAWNYKTGAKAIMY